MHELPASGDVGMPLLHAFAHCVFHRGIASIVGHILVEIQLEDNRMADKSVEGPEDGVA